ncbi:hypothetical protein CONCODRAFT_15893 [Conidiobolus coronatus NRRL 28638]|uniref:G-protein coupled receptors family 1 profile domain-containing protein n=1 Tax=Conidiobolus coronatus (strain ATCC 28846 / CBS 209.66 / NRRL 28638) TaxID=796925 RepID=A0A137PD12_CONC2|nr:hypothetical protein CONCODRAFT_15893 [Conidiobolus coronatus NRRL 28638]|eukprot:KXN72880.1 hypothetical protein CONCODRAFT_15893 [Conidiobolus coronatus NRRL 28638]
MSDLASLAAVKEISAINLDPGFLTGEIIMFLLSAAGLFLNLVVIYILLIRIRILKIDTVLSCLITFLDILSTISLMVRIGYKWGATVADDGDLFNNKIFCKASGTIFFASTLSSFDVVSILAVIRCLVIVFNVKFHSIWWSILLGITLGFNWIGSSILTWNFTEISWGNFCQVGDAFEGELHKSEAFGPIISLKAFVMVFIVTISYIFILRFYHKYYDSMKRSSQLDQALITEIKTQKSATSLKLIGVIIAYILIYLPKIILFILYNFKIWGFFYGWEVATSVLLSMSSLINASVILFIQEETKHEWQVLMALLFHRVKTIY